MHVAQDWCLHCGAGAPSRLRTGPGWRTAALAIGGTAALALGAAAAAYAALEQRSPHKPPVPTPVAQKPAAPAPSTQLPSTPQTPGNTTPGGSVPPIESQPETLKTPSRVPKIPSSTPAPTSRQAAKPTRKASEKAKKASKETGEPAANEPGGESRKSGEEKETAGKQKSESVPVLLDPNAAQIYNPNDFPPTRFGDPSLSIDGEATTAWTVQLEPAEAPDVNAGLSLDLNAPLKIAKLTVITETPGFTVQVYGTKARKLPKELASEEWVRLSRAHLVKRSKATIELSESSARFRQLLIWILKAPTSSSGEFTLGEAKINELQVYEAK
jgi:hypothetical protein